MADGLERLLNVLVEREILRVDQKNVEMTASPRTPAETVDANQLIEIDRERHRAAELGPAFIAGLRRAYDARRAGQHDFALDDRRFDENAIADAMVQFLVRTQLATSHTEQTEPNHYIYHIAIDWARLAQLAAESGIDLDRELTEE